MRAEEAGACSEPLMMAVQPAEMAPTSGQRASCQG